MEENDLSAELYHAVVNNEIEKVRQLLQNGADPDEYYHDMQNISSTTILHVGCGKGRREIVELLVDAGANVISRDKWRMTPIVYSIMSQYHDVTEFILTRYPPAADVGDKYGKAPLHYAIESDSIESVSMIIKHGGDVNIGNMHGTTPLMLLCSTPGLTNRITMMKMFLEAEAIVDLRDLTAKRTALQYAVCKKNVEATEILLGAGADPNTVDAAGRTPLTNVMWEFVRVTDTDKEIDQDVMTIIILLIQVGAELNMNLCEYSSPLTVAAFLKAEPLIKLFLDYDANPDITFASGVTPLLVAVGKKDFASAKTLVSYNCRLDMVGRVNKQREEFNFDPFELAVDSSLWNMVNLFVAFGYKLSKHPYLCDTSSPESVPVSLQNNPEVLLYLRDFASMPFSLFKLTVLFLRKTFKCKISEKVSELPLPVSMKKAIMMEEFLI